MKILKISSAVTCIKATLTTMKALLAFTLLSIISMSSLNAQTTEVNNYVSIQGNKFIYQPEFFARYAPQTATDMVLQIPGFKLNNTNQNGGNDQSEIRGLGQGNGNLLLNGKRVSSKDNGPLDLLARIPAENVQQIEILTQGSSELAGQSGQIVNVIFIEPEKVNGSWAGNVHTQEKGITKGSLETSITGKYNNLGYSASINRYSNEFPQWGEETAFDKDNQLWEIRDEHSDFYNNGLELRLGMTWKGRDEQTANLNVSTSREKFTFYENSDRYEPLEPQKNILGALVSEVDFRVNEDISSYEVGADYSRTIGEGTWKIIGLRRYQDIESNTYFENNPTADVLYAFKSISKPTETESVLRTIYSFKPQDGHSVDIALEGAKNTLKTSSLFEENTGNGYTVFDVDGSDIEVSEDRAEFSAQYSRPVFTGWSIQSLFATEYSKLSVMGDTDPRSETFNRYKGFVALNGALSEQSSLRTRLERSVGQLSFGDFASSKNVNEGTDNGGNTQLVPEQTWRAELSYERTFGATDMLTITAFMERVDHFITFVPFGNGNEGRDNIDKLTSKGIDISTTIALDRFGLEGAKLDLSGEFHQGKIIDPVTGKEIKYQQFGYNPVHYKASFRHDIPGTTIAWGISVEELSRATNHRLNQTAINDHRWPQSHIFFFEYKDLAGMTLKIETEDLLGFTWKNSRTFYEGDRNGDITGAENNSRHSPWLLRISLTGNF